MTERGPIVCATDLSKTGAEATEIAARVAASTGRPLHIVHVTGAGPELIAGEPRDETERVFKERLRVRLDAAATGLERERVHAESLGPHAEAELLEGRPWEQLVEYATRKEASMVVVGPHGHAGPKQSTRRGLTEWILGSTADRVLRHAPCPVLIGPRGSEHAPSLHGGTWLVAIDFSAPSRAALKVAHELAGACEAKLVALHVATDPVAHLDPAGDEEPFPARDVMGERAATGKLEELHELVKGELGEDLEVRVASGEPAYEVAATANEVSAKLIVMGTHGRSGLSHILLGSTAERTLRLSSVPVLTVRD